MLCVNSDDLGLPRSSIGSIASNERVERVESDRSIGANRSGVFEGTVATREGEIRGSFVRPVGRSVCFSFFRGFSSFGTFARRRRQASSFVSFVDRSFDTIRLIDWYRRRRGGARARERPGRFGRRRTRVTNRTERCHDSDGFARVVGVVDVGDGIVVVGVGWMDPARGSRRVRSGASMDG